MFRVYTAIAIILMIFLLFQMIILPQSRKKSAMQVVGTILENLAAIGDCRILVTPDHPTPVSKRTHTSDPVPYILFDSRHSEGSGPSGYSEENAARCGAIVPGHQLLSLLLDRCPSLS